MQSISSQSIPYRNEGMQLRRVVISLCHSLMGGSRKSPHGLASSYVGRSARKHLGRSCLAERQRRRKKVLGPGTDGPRAGCQRAVPRLLSSPGSPGVLAAERTDGESRSYAARHSPPIAPNRRPEGHQAGGRAGGQSSKHRQKPRPRRARRSALTGLVSIPRSRNSRPITSRQTPISSAM